MNVLKTAKKIQALTVAVQMEVNKLEAHVKNHKAEFNTTLEKMQDGFNRIVAAYKERHANKAITLNKKAEEARQCLCTLQK